MNMTLYPLLMAPYFRSGKETPWGGDMLRDAFMKDAPEQTGESLEVSALEGRESIVRNGAYAGTNLRRMAELWGKELTGTDSDAVTLLLKLIDAKETLSVQVHPDDAYAQAHEGKTGKTEAWVILNCEPGAKIAYGLDTRGEDLAVIAERGGAAIENSIHWVNVRPGDVYYIPHGLAHAIGAGIQLFEIQQSSDVTYRFWDWNRTGRELHIAQAVEVSRPELHPAKLYGTTALCKGGSRTYYIANEYFELSRLNVSGRMPVDDGRMLLLMPLGCCTLHWCDEEMQLAPFESIVVPAGLGNVVIESEDCKVLLSAVSNREALREELGYRAENVAGLTE